MRRIRLFPLNPDPELEQLDPRKRVVGTPTLGSSSWALAQGFLHPQELGHVEQDSVSGSFSELLLSGRQLALSFL